MQFKLLLEVSSVDLVKYEQLIISTFIAV